MASSMANEILIHVKKLVRYVIICHYSCLFWDDTDKDNYPKAKGMLAYSKANEPVSRIELIREVDGKLWRLDFKDAVIRNKMKDVKDNETLDILFHKIHHPV
jgi:hypothetical protein